VEDKQVNCCVMYVLLPLFVQVHRYNQTEISTEPPFKISRSTFLAEESMHICFDGI